MISRTPAQLRSLYEYANTHRVFDLGLLLRAADEMDRMQEQIDGYRRYIDEIDRLHDEPPGPVADDQHDDTDGM